jgi:hypothetical protein
MGTALFILFFSRENGKWVSWGIADTYIFNNILRKVLQNLKQIY